MRRPGMVLTLAALGTLPGLLVACRATDDARLERARTGARSDIVTVTYALPSDLDLVALQAAATPPGTAPPAPPTARLASRESGASPGAIHFRLNAPLLQRLVLQPDDVLTARLSWQVVEQAELRDATITVWLLLKRSDNRVAVAQARATDAIAGNRLELELSVPYVREMVEGKLADEFVLALTSPDPRAALVLVAPGPIKPENQQPELPRLSLTLRKHVNHELFDWPVKPRAGVYCTVRDGRLYYGEERLRTWGVCRGPSYNPAQVERMRKMGFNAVRLWGPRRCYTESTVKEGRLDPQAMDSFDRYVAELKAQGMWIMAPCLMSRPAGFGESTQELLLADDSWLAREHGGADWAQWKAAATASPELQKMCEYFDERFQAIRRRHTAAFLNHVNPYTGRRYAEEESIFMYEIWNEDGILKWVLEGAPPRKAFSGWPPYFQNKLTAKWNAWLQQRYGDDAGLARAWGRLDAGESPAAGSVKFVPLYPQRNDYPKQRGDDLVRFMIELVDRWNQDFRAYCRTFAKPGVGVAAVPFSCDTQYRHNIPWLYADAQGDVVCFGMYENRVKSALDAPPGINVVDSITVAGKPSVLYEVNRGHPDPHRTEYPVQLAALGNWQDWDGIFWHYFQEPGASWQQMNQDEHYLVQPLWYVTPNQTDDLWIETDPAMCAATALAGQAFLWQRLRPAPSPLTVTVGGAGIFSYDLLNGIPLRDITFAQGARVAFRPQDMGLVADPPRDQLTRTFTQAIRAGDQITYDWPNGRLIIDAPTVKAYVGKVTPRHQFQDGVVLEGVGGEHVTWLMVSADGKPLAGPDASRRIYVNAVHEAANSGFQMDLAGLSSGFVHPNERKQRVKVAGQPPVVVDRIPYRVTLPGGGGYRFRGYDFALRQCLDRSGTGPVVHAGQPIYMGVIERP